LFLLEGASLAFLGGLVGAFGGLAYARTMLWSLATVWRDAIAGSQLRFYASGVTILTGLLASTVVAVLAIWLTLRKQARQPAQELLTGQTHTPKTQVRSWGKWVGLSAGLAALGSVGWAMASGNTTNAEVFFTAGSFLLIAGLGLVAAWMASLAQKQKNARLTFTGLGVRGCSRRRKRSLATVALLASGAFVVLSIGVFRLDANRDAAKRSSGTGGFALLGESAIPVVKDLNSSEGREFFGVNDNEMTNVTVVPFRVRQGDDASCLNLNRAQKPRLLGVKPELLDGRFTFSSVEKGLDRRKGWLLLKNQEDRLAPASTPQNLSSSKEIPAIGDANSIQWALGKKLGDTIDYTDERGHAFKIRLVAAVANSILQGSLIIDEAEFVKRFPNESGHRMFLLDIPSNSVSRVSASLSRALQDAGLELTPAVRRLNELNAVQNTYLNTFQVLGGLGLLLGSAGLGVVVLRNVLERRGELGLLLAVGFRKNQLQKLVLSEHGALLGFGLSIGILAAALAVLPALVAPGSQLPYASLAVTLAAVFANGLVWTWFATRYALRGNLLEALRNE
jgi:putative ABC transport system permease protein